jgi:stage IV sporulation protein FB
LDDRKQEIAAEVNAARVEADPDVSPGFPGSDRGRQRRANQGAQAEQRGLGYSRSVSAFHLFTIAGIPVSASPFYFLLLFMFAGGNLMRGLIWGVCITLSLLVHELGHALVARHLRHEPSIMLHGFGGLTSRTRSGRDVEEAAIIATGPAAGLALGLGIFGLWRLLGHAGLEDLAFSAVGMEWLYALLVPCITWNLLNLIPLWPLDGGQLFRLGVLRFTRGRRADVITHGLSLVLIAGLGVWALQARSVYGGVVLLMLAAQNIRALRGQESSGPDPVRGSSVASELLSNAQQAFDEGNFREAARLAQQARAMYQMSPVQLEKTWEILGRATAELGEHEEALAYLRRARPNEATRAATERVLLALGRDGEIGEYRVLWQGGGRRAPNMAGWLIGALGFIVIAVGFVFTTSLSAFFR